MTEDGRRPAAGGRWSYLAWGAVGGRSNEIAAALGGEAVSLYAPGPNRRPHAAWRYLHCSLATVWHLRKRPAFVIVTNPPVLAGLVAYACGRLAGFPVVLDSHPGAFGAQGDELSRRLAPLHRFLARRVACSMVAAEPWAEIVESWGGRAVVVHEAPRLEPIPPRPPAERLQVLYVGRFAGDEPIEAVLEAARLSPGCDLLVTGDPAACPGDLRASAPPNVRFVGFLPPGPYEEAIASSDAVLTLTTEPASVMRAAYEAIYAGRPVIVSGWPIAREVFPHAIHVDNEPASIAGGLSALASRRDELLALAGEARALQVARWQRQEHGLRREIDRALSRRP